MPKDIKIIVREIEKLLGHSLKDTDHLLVALTHRSYANEIGLGDEDNERLEFLGDAVLDLVVSDVLMKLHPEEQEGALSKFRSSIVNERSLAKAARSMSLGAFVRLGKGEERTLGREKNSILANTFEAVVAAIYLSGGLSDAETFLMHHLEEMIKSVEASLEKSDYKTSLQEFTQKNLKTTPNYVLTFEGGPDHEKIFETEVWIQDRVYGCGRAKSKKDSEQHSAKQALQSLQKEVGAME